MTDDPRRWLRIPGAFNIRDLGGYAADCGHTRWRRVMRADAPHKIGAEDLDRLCELGVRTVIDLRHADEIKRAPNPFQARPPVIYISIPLFHGLRPAFPEHEGAGPAGLLLDMYRLALTDRHEAVAAAICAVADARDGTVLVHCSAGKDRTGIIAALLLSVAGVADKVIAEDYGLTAGAMAPVIDRMSAEAVQAGMPAEYVGEILGCEPETMLGMLRHIEELFGSTRGYLSHIGVDAGRIERLLARFVEPVQTGIR